MTEPPALRAFLAHPKSSPDDEIETLKATATALLGDQIARHRGSVRPCVIPGRDDFNDRVMACGGWEAWSASVVDGTGYVDGALRSLYDLIIVSPTAVVGKATADMISRALTNADPGKRKPVFFMPHPDAPDGARLYPVINLRPRDGNDFRRSHTLVFLQPI